MDGAEIYFIRIRGLYALIQTVYNGSKAVVV